MEEEFYRSRPRDPSSTLVFLVGPSGSGKSRTAERVAKEILWQVVDTDDVIRTQSGFSDLTALFEEEGEESFREREREVVRHLARTSSRTVVATGGGLPAIPGLMTELNEIGVTIYLRAELETLWKRLTTNPTELANRPLLADGGIAALATLVERRESVYNRASIVVDTDTLSAREVSNLVVAQVRMMMDLAGDR